jgi:septal ring factor EnvC (AmiA/AmiB activator)
MAAADYLRAASGELRKAAQDLNLQVRSAQADYDHQRRNLDSAIKSTELEIRTKEASLAAMDDASEKKGLSIQINMLNRLVGDRKKELDSARGNVDSMVGAKLAFANQLESLAGQLDGLAGRPEAG